MIWFIKILEILIATIFIIIKQKKLNKSSVYLVIFRNAGGSEEIKREVYPMNIFTLEDVTKNLKEGVWNAIFMKIGMIKSIVNILQMAKLLFGTEV